MSAPINNLDSFVRKQCRRFADHYDDHGAAIASRLTIATIAEVFKYKTPGTPWASEELITIQSPDSGATSIDWHMVGDGNGPNSAIMADGGEYPLVDIFTEQNHNAIGNLGTGFRYTEQEMDSYRMSGLNGSLEAQKAAAAKAFHDRALNSLILSGVTGVHVGVLGLPGISSMIAGTATGTTAAWVATATPEQICDSVLAMRQAIETQSSGTLIPDTVVFPTAVQNELRKDKSVASHTSILQWLKDALPEITLWAFDVRMNTAGLAGGNCAIMYNRTPSHISVQMPVRLKPNALNIRHDVFTQTFRSRYGGIVCPYPKAVATLNDF